MEKLKLHDTCGIHNLHGMPSVISALASVVMCAIASGEVYGEERYIHNLTIYCDLLLYEFNIEQHPYSDVQHLFLAV